MALTRRVVENRSTLIFAGLVLLSLASLVTEPFIRPVGAPNTPIKRMVINAASAVTYPFIVAFDGASGLVSGAVGIVTSYSDMEAQTRELREELALSQQRVALFEETMRENDRLRAMLAFQRENPRLSLLPAKVDGVNRGVLTIDRGSLHGVRESMCAITKDGVVGDIVSVTPFTAQVNSLHEADFKIGVKVKRSRVRGVVHGSGNRFSHFCELQYIGESDDVLRGDLIVTSEESRFPSGLIVGRVSTAPGSGSLLVTAYVEPAVNPFAVEEVYVVVGASAAPRDDAPPPAAEASGESSGAYAMPDERTVQEKLAP